MYGWRARVGLIIAHSNTTMEPEFQSLAPEGVSVHTSRVAIGERSKEGLRVGGDRLGSAAQLLAEVNAKAIGYACTAVNILAGPEEDLVQASRVSEICGCPAIPASIAIAEALRALDVRRIAIATVCPDDVNIAIAEYWTGLGFEVLNIGGLDLGGGRKPVEPISDKPISQQGLQTDAVVYNMARAVHSKGAEAVVVSGANLRSASIASAFESDFGVPLVSSGLATIWACLQASGIRAPIAGAGYLLDRQPDLRWWRLPTPHGQKHPK